MKLKRMFDRWEHGSEFYWPFFGRINETVSTDEWERCGQFYGSGRDAIRALLVYGQNNRGWKRLWMPSYFCQDVVSSILSTGISVSIYNDAPETAAPDLSQIFWQRGDALLIVNYFGLRQKPSFGDKIPADVEIIEDHTHDPWATWARESKAEWCFASLRKTLPLGCGAVLWSPAGLSMPVAPAVSFERHVAALEKMAAMMMKKYYLEDYPVDKDIYRRLQLSGEEHISSGEVSGMPEWARILIPMFPIDLWRKKRFFNYKKLIEALKDKKWLRVLKPQTCDDICPFVCILKFDTRERREFVFKNLINARIYAVVLWPLEDPRLPGVRAEDRDFSRRMLAIHCDMRYLEDDMEKVASLIKQVGAAYDERKALFKG